jgi:hypothetical protein
MSAIMITCPETGIEVPVGIDTDEASFQKIPRAVGTTTCPACGKVHEWTVSDAKLQERERTQRPA